MTRKTLFYTLFFLALVLGFYQVMKRVIPGYGERKFKVLNEVKPFAFTDQRGRRITERDVEGKVYVAEFFFTTCKGICPVLNTNLHRVYEKYRNEPDFLILSHTCDPETDSVARLYAYADSLGVDHHKWLFLTGTKDSLYTSARVSYLLDDPKNNRLHIDDQFIHTQFFALVDRQGRVRRKIYDGLKKKEVQELENDIAVLLRELPEHSPFVNNLFRH